METKMIYWNILFWTYSQFSKVQSVLKNEMERVWETFKHV